MAATGNPSRKRVRKVGKSILIALAGLAVVVVAALVFLHTDAGRDFVREQVEKQLNLRLNGRITIDKLSGSLLSNPRLEGVTVFDLEGREVVAVEALTLEYSLFDVLGAELAISGIFIDKPQVALVVSTTGGVNLASLWKPPEDDEPILVVIENIGLTDGALTIERAGEPAQHVDGLAIELKNLRSYDVEVDLDRAHVAAHWVEEDWSLGVSAAVRVDQAGLRLDRLHLNAGLSSLVFEKPVEYRFDMSHISANGNLHATARDVAKLVPELQLASDVTGTVSAARNGTTAAFALAADLVLAGNSISWRGRFNPDTLTTESELVMDSIALRDIVDTAPDVEVGGKATVELVGLWPQAMRGTARGEFHGRYGARQFSSVAVEAVMRGHEVDVSLVAKTDAGDARGSASLDLQGETPIVATSELQLDGVSVAAWLPDSVAARGVARLHASAQGPVDSLWVRGQAHVNRASWNDLSAARLDVAFSARGVPDKAAGTASVHARGVRRAGELMGDVRGTATLAPGGEKLGFSVQSGESKRGLAIAGSGEVRFGRKAVTIAVNNGQVSARGATWKISPTKIHVGYDGELRVDKLAIAAGHQHGTIVVDGSLGKEMRFRARGLDLADLTASGLADVPVTGTVDIDGTLTGRISSLRGSIAIEFSGVKIDGSPHEISGVARVDIAAREVNLTAQLGHAKLGQATIKLSLQAPRDPLDVETWARTGLAAFREAQVDIANLQLRSLATWLGLANAHTLSGAMHVAVRAGNKLESVELTARLEEGAFDSRVEDITGNLRARVSGAWVDVDADVAVPGIETVTVSSRVALPAGLVRMTTWPALDETWVRDIMVTIKNFDLGQLAEFSPDLAELRGKVSVALSAQPWRQTATASTVVTGLGYGDSLAFDVDAQANLHDRIDVTVAVKQRRELLAGSLSLATNLSQFRRRGMAAIREARLSGKLATRALPLASLAEFAGVSFGRQIEGLLSATATVAGSVAVPETEVVAEVRGTEVDGVDFGDFDGVIALSPQRVHAEVEAAQKQGGRLALEGSYLFREQTLEIEFRSRRYDLGFLGVLAVTDDSPFLKIAGVVDAGFSVSGPVRELVPLGWLRVQGGAISLRSGLQPLTEIRLAVRTAESGLNGELRFRSGTGHVNGDFHAVLAGGAFRRVRGNLTLDEFPVVTGANAVSIDAQVKVGAKNEDGLWHVDTVLSSVRVSLPEVESRELHSIGTLDDVRFVGEEAEEVEKVRRKGFGTVLAKVSIRADDNIRLRGEVIDADLGANVDVSVAENGVRIHGVAAVTRGWIEIVDRRYLINTAQANFTGKSPPNPNLAVQLSRDFGDLDLRIHVGGTAREPQLRLSSEPGIYDQATLLAIVMGGQPSDLSDNPTASEEGLSAQALDALTGVVLAEVRNVVPIDVVRFDVSGEQLGVTGGHWVFDWLYFGLSRHATVDQLDNAYEANAEVRLSNRWSVEAIGGLIKSGVDLIWINRY